MALTPPPRKHRHRYFGVLAPNSPPREAVTALAQPAARVKLLHLSLASEEVAIARVAMRVRQGEHNIPTDVIRRRYLDGTRRKLFRRFPFALVYRVKDEHLQVLAVAHQHRRPGYWIGR